MAAVSMAAVTVPPTTEPAPSGTARCVLHSTGLLRARHLILPSLCKGRCLKWMRSSAPASQTKPAATMENRKLHRICARFCEYLIQPTLDRGPAMELCGFGMLIVANQRSLTHLLPNTNQNAVGGWPEDSLWEDKLDPNKKYNTGTSLDPEKLEIKLH